MVKEEIPNIIFQGESFTVEFKGEEKSPLYLTMNYIKQLYALPMAAEVYF